MKTTLLALLTLLLCTTSGFSYGNDVVSVGRSYEFRVIGNTTITAKVMRKLNDNWIMVQQNNQKMLLNLQTVITVHDLLNGGN